MKVKLSYYNAIIANAFEISSLCSETQIGENKERLHRFVLLLRL
jgi:hypothetical protein